MPTPTGQATYGDETIWTGQDGAPVQTTHIDYDRREIDISDEIRYLVPDATPFITILMRAATQPTTSAEFKWYDKDRPEWWTELTASYASSTSSTTIELDDVSFLNEKDLIKNVATGEIMFVTDVDATNSEVTVDREYTRDDTASTGTEAASSSGSDDNIIKLGNASEENSLAPDPYVTQPTKRFNYIQTFRTPFSSSATNEAEPKRAGPQTRQRLRREKLIDHRIDIERQFLFGERNEVFESNGDIRRVTGGVFQFIRMATGTTVRDLGSTNNGVLTEQEWENFCEGALQYGSDTKMFLTSTKVGGILNQHAAGRIETTSGDETYGMKLREYQTFNGRVIIATTELFEKDYANLGVMLDMENLAYRPFDGDDSKLYTNIQENDRDGWKDEYRTKAGLKLELPKTHGILEGIQS